MNSFSTRLAILLSLLLMVLMIPVGLVLEHHQTETIDQEERAQVVMLAETLYSSLEVLMETGNGPLVRGWLEQLAGTQGIESIQIARRDGQLAFRDLDTLNRVNAHLKHQRFERTPTPSQPLRDVDAAAFQRAVRGERTAAISPDGHLSLVFPIMTKHDCLSCHGYEDNPVRGVLNLHLYRPDIQARIEAMRWNLWSMILGVSLVLGFAAWAVVRGTILLPLERVRDAMVMAGRGERTIVMPTGRGDEIGDLSRSFNKMQHDLKVKEEEARVLAVHAPEGIVTFDGEGRIRGFNPAAEKMFGYRAEAMAGHAIALLFADSLDNRPALNVLAQIATARPNEERIGMESLGRRADGSRFVMEWSLGEVGIDPEERWYIAMVRDATPRLERESNLRKISQAIEQTTDSVMITDRDGAIEYVNPAFEKLTGYTAREVLGKNPRLLKSGEHGDDYYRQMWETILAGEPFADVVVNRRKDGSLYYEQKTSSPLKNDRGWLTHFVSTDRDVTEQKRLEEKLHFLASHDRLTGLPNRTLLHDRLRQALVHARRHNGHVAVMFLDLDRFKEVNDTLGHQAGDLLLVEVANRLQSGLRDGDTVTRIGGDEFVLVIEELSGTEVAEQVAEKLLKNLHHPIEFEEWSILPSGSLGIACFPEDGDSEEALIAKADEAMYLAKKMGRNRYQRYGK